MSPNLSLIIKDARAESCPAGFKFDSVLNRCLTNEQTTKVMNVTRQCGNNADCYKQNAIEELQKAEAEGKAPKRVESKDGMGAIGNTLATATIAGYLTVAIKGTAGPAGAAADGAAKGAEGAAKGADGAAKGADGAAKGADGATKGADGAAKGADGAAKGADGAAKGADGAKESSGGKCTSISYWTIVGGSVAFLIGDNLANMQHASRLKKIKEKWGKIVNPEQAGGNVDKEREISQNAQSEAFGLLAEAEESLSKAAGMKKTFYMVAGIAYSVAAIAAAVEWANPGNVCASASVTKESDFYYAHNQPLKNLNKQFAYNLRHSPDLVSFLVNKKALELNYSSPSLDDYEEVKKNFSDISLEKDLFQTFKEISFAVISNIAPISNAQAKETKKKSSVDTNAANTYKEEEAKGINWVSLGIGAAAGAALGYFFSKQLAYPGTRAALATLMAGWSFIMSSHAGKQAEAAKKRAELLRQMQKDFNVASSTLNTCKAEDRDDPAKPECYCYTVQNQKNPNRANSQVCQRLWAGISLTPTNYLAKDTQTKVCITNDRQADPTCSCRAKNTCMKVGVNGLGGLSTGSLSVMSKSLDPLNKLANGSADAGSFGDASLANMASKLKSMNDQLDKNPKMADFAKKKKKAMDNITATLSKGSAGMTNNPLLGSSGGSMPTNPGEAARMLEKELENNTPKSIGGSNDSIATPSNKPNKDEIDLNIAGGDEDSKDEKLAEVMKKDLDYGKNDINSDSNSIFEILTNRYKRSGMRRLFDEEGTSKPDEPAKSDITE
jgi:hypothetical protein